MTSMNPAAEAARENARTKTGQFGNQQHSTPEPIDHVQARMGDREFELPVYAPAEKPAPLHTDDPHLQALYATYGEVDRANDRLLDANMESHAAGVAEHFPDDIDRVDVLVVQNYDDDGYSFHHFLATSATRADGTVLERHGLIAAGANLEAADDYLRTETRTAAGDLDRDGEETATLHLGTDRRDPESRTARAAAAHAEVLAASHQVHAAENKMLDANARVIASDLGKKLPDQVTEVQVQVAEDYNFDGFYYRLEFTGARGADGEPVEVDGGVLSELADDVNARGRGYEVAALADERGDSIGTVVVRGGGVGICWD